MGLHLPHCPKSRTLAHLAALHARHEFEQGHWKEGWEDVTDLLKLGRHVEMGPQFVSDGWVTGSRRMRSRQRPPTCRS